jgi:hypothetical protein
MVLHARSDIQGAIIPVASGGCGELHSRPVTDGAPAKVWRLDCPRCCAVLQDDSLWAAAESEIPETYDEQRVREDKDKRGAKDQSEATGVALEELAKMPGILEALTALVAGQKVEVAAVVPCRDCDTSVTAGQRFCPECGARDPAEAALVPDAPSSAFAVDSHRVADVPLPGEPPADDGPLDLAALPYSKLKQLAVTRGLSGKGTKPELIERLSAAA